MFAIPSMQPPSTRQPLDLTPHLKTLRSVLIRRGLRGAHVDDALQETCVRALQTSTSPRSAEKLRPWLCAIAHNVCTDLYARNMRTQYVYTYGNRMEYGGDTPRNPEEMLLEDERSEQLREAIETLPPSQRSLVRDVYLNEHTYAHTQTHHNLSKNALASRLHRAKQRLRTTLENARYAWGGTAVGSTPISWPIILGLSFPVLSFLLPTYSTHVVPKLETITRPRFYALCLMGFLCNISPLLSILGYNSTWVAVSGLLYVLSIVFATSLLTLHLKDLAWGETNILSSKILSLFACSFSGAFVFGLYEIIVHQNMTTSLIPFACGLFTGLAFMAALSFPDLFKRRKRIKAFSTTLVCTATFAGLYIHLLPSIESLLVWLLTNCALIIAAHLSISFLLKNSTPLDDTAYTPTPS